MDLYLLPPELVHVGNVRSRPSPSPTGSSTRMSAPLEAVQHMFRVEMDVDALTPIEPDALAAAVTAPSCGVSWCGA